MTHPSIDHSLLSPSGRMSKRARKAALEREARRLFPAGTFEPAPMSESEHLAEQALSLRRAAANLRELAARGMSTKRFAREADRLDAEALALETR